MVSYVYWKTTTLFSTENSVISLVEPGSTYKDRVAMADTEVTQSP